ncbi:carbohydrate ABC transporter permease [Georgenia sp. AZ-5]|uniref:carbohydrate ABC transporter permease n=1 Tax=Georgenia sp. AZ-5 TaxID=3367526 RepID=UPI003755087A
MSDIPSGTVTGGGTAVVIRATPRGAAPRGPETAPGRGVRRPNYWLFMLPALVAILALIVVPLGYAVFLSLRRYDLRRGIDEFVGLQNYAEILSGGDPAFVASLLRTLLYVVVVITADFLIGFTQALLLFSMRPAVAKVFRMLFMLPILIIPTASAVFWRTIMWAPPNQQFLRTLGLEGVIPPPLGESSLALWAIIITVIWAWSPWVFLLLAGGLDSLDRNVIDAARVDGASYVQRLRHIILPLMKPVIFVTLSFKAVDSFLSFPFIWVMTEGGPGGSTHLMSTYIYEQAFQFLNYGFGSALAIVMLLISSVLSIGSVLYWNRTHGKEL